MSGKEAPRSAGMQWQRSDPTLGERFTAIAGEMGLERRKMFGEQAGFVNGWLTTGLHAGRWFVRLGEVERTAALALDGAVLFAPMPDRPMKDYVVLPPQVVSDEPSLKAWVARAVEHSRSLPPKR